jgi:FOG: Transposase
MRFKITKDDIANQAGLLKRIHQKFSQYFKTRTKDVSNQALEYLKGLLGLECKKNMSQMAQKITNVDKQVLQNFISESPWKDEPFLKDVQSEIVSLITGHSPNDDMALIGDESGFPKQGKDSVGVKRQYCGALGKVDNCQMGVFLAYASTTQTSLIARSLYMPEEWCSDKERCDQAKVPQNKRGFKTKTQLLMDLIDQAAANGVPFTFISTDAGYDQNWFLDDLDAKGRIYVIDIGKDALVHLGWPKMTVEELAGGTFKVNVLTNTAVKVEDLVNEEKIEFHRLTIRDTQRGELVIDFGRTRIYRSLKGVPCAKEEWLLIRKEIDGSDIRYSFSNAPETIELQRHAEWQCRRYWVERALEDAKGLAGLGDYRVRGWNGWHHHTALVMLAMVFC